MRATLVATLDLEAGVTAIEPWGERFVIAQPDRARVVDDTTLERLHDVDVFELRGGHILTRGRIIGLDGSTMTVPFEAALRFAPLPDGAIVAVDPGSELVDAAVYRLDKTGNIVWRASTAPPATIAGYVSEARREDNFAIKPKRPWKPTRWTARFGRVHLSGDRVLVVYADMPRSGLGIAYGIDAASGAVVYTTPPAPYHEIAPARDAGAFLVGVQGYGAFETRLVERDGAVRTTWRSHGLVLPGDPVRVIEMENTIPSRSHMATLVDDGRVLRGAHLPGYYTSPAIVAADDSAVFWRDNALLRASPDNKRLDRLLQTSVPGSPYSRGFCGRIPGRVVLHLSTNHDADGAFVAKHHVLVIDVA